MPSLLVIKRLAAALEPTMAHLMEELELPGETAEPEPASRSVPANAPVKKRTKKGGP
ncbi:MAG TPA: hypothetical protein VD866_33335 [Urbifossiella sp.]|nr:hypothetical protein [Urbifossiella sp.]